MRNYHVVAVLLVIALSANAGGQTIVGLSPSYEKDTGMYAEHIDANDNWLVMNHRGSTILLRNRDSGQEYYLWLDMGNTLSQESERTLLIDDFVVAAGTGTYYKDGGLIGVWDLNNLETTQVSRVGSVPGISLYTPQNWTVEIDLDRLFVIKENGLFGTCDYDAGIISLFKIGSDGPVMIQEIAATDLVTCAAAGDYLAAGLSDAIVIYRYNSSLEIFNRLFGIAWEAPKYSQKSIGMTIAKDGTPYLIAQVNNASSMFVENLLTRSQSIFEAEDVSEEIYSADGDFCFIKPAILHVPSATFVASITTHPDTEVGHSLSFSACIRDLGDSVEIVTAESPFGYAWGYLTVYQQKTHTVSVPTKTQGTVKLLTSPRVLPGGSATFAVVGKGKRRVKTVFWSDGRVQNAGRKSGGLILSTTDIRDDVGIERIALARSKRMNAFSVYAPNTKVVGRAVPDEENPSRWYYDLPLGRYAGWWENYDRRYELVPRYIIITVRKDGVTKTDF